MKLKHSAKTLTFTYFSIITIAIIGFHFILFKMTIEDFEDLLVKNRIEALKEEAFEQLRITGKSAIKLEPNMNISLDKKTLPLVFQHKKLQLNQIHEFFLSIPEKREFSVFMYKTTFDYNGKQTPVYFQFLDTTYDETETEIYFSQTRQILTSILLLLISLFIIKHISQKLTSPLSTLSKTLAKRSPENHLPIPLPSGTVSKELTLLVAQLNQDKQNINQLIQRERAFNRFASHELRTPLMVIKGAISLIRQGENTPFIEKQLKRLTDASNEMNDFVTTLLSLTQEDNINDQSYLLINEDVIENIINSYTSHIRNKNMVYRVEVVNSIKTKVPFTTLKILLGNLIKNSFYYTEEGAVIIRVQNNSIKVIDSGVGLYAKPKNNSDEGFGLGLLLVKDICRKYSWIFSLKNNENQPGCCAEINMSAEELN